MAPVLRWLTAGESHGPALTAMLEGMVAGVEITTKELAAELARRKLGYGRSPRMAFEADELEAGLHHPEQLAQVIARRFEQPHTINDGRSAHQSPARVLQRCRQLSRVRHEQIHRSHGRPPWLFL